MAGALRAWAVRSLRGSAWSIGLCALRLKARLSLPFACAATMTQSRDRERSTYMLDDFRVALLNAS